MARVELNEMDMENVVGGAFRYNTYKNPDGTEYMKCKVDGVGIFYCSDNAKKKITAYIMNFGAQNISAAEVVDWAKSNGYFWN